MLKMQYKSFVWPNNPERYTLCCERKTAVQQAPMSGFVTQDLGPTCMILRGEGEFFGSEAMNSFLELVRVFRDEGAGVLLHPAWQGAQAYFTKLRLSQEPRRDYVAYEFEFCECEPQASGQTAYVTRRRARGGKIYYTVTSGQSAWEVCARHELTMQELMEMNPSLASPTGLTDGQRLRVQ